MTGGAEGLIKLLARYAKLFAVASALVLTGAGSIALFVMIPSLSTYIGSLKKDQFYTPVPNATDTIFSRAFGGLVLLRFALWPALVFVLVQAGATYAISTLLPFRGRFAVMRRLAAGAGVSVLMSALLLAAMWPMLVR